MDCTSTRLSYGETGYFTNIVSAYINGDEQLKQFYHHPPTFEGIAAAIQQRKEFPTNRKLLVEVLRSQYKAVSPSPAVEQSIDLLPDENTFAVTTAHQPAIFTGNLFFVYKILHTIKLAEELSKQFSGKKFVPVFYMGSEDADLDELGHIYMSGEKVAWQTQQTGAIGRMNTKGLDKVINRIEGELLVQPHGEELMKLIRECYLNSPDIQTATFKLIHSLFSEYGLIVFIPDNAEVKRAMIGVFEDELFNHRCNGVVSQAIENLAQHFKVQANPREINLFYLKDNIRQRIEKKDNTWQVVETGISFTKEELMQELHQHPERFSPNVILRGLMQESLLPGIAFIGGGGELAYWLELKGVFKLYSVPYPVLVVRNSFLVITEKWKQRIERLRLSITDIFRSETDLLNELVKQQSSRQLSLAEEITHAENYYDRLKSVASQVDDSLTVHVAALQTRAIKPLQELEKKLLRAEKRKYEDAGRQLAAIKREFFPNGSLQERVDNFMPYYAKWGSNFIKAVYEHSPALEQEFTILVVKE